MSDPSADRASPSSTLIIANGPFPARTMLRGLFARADLTVATDGAADRLLSIGLTPDIVLGDFDSLGVSARAALRPEALVETPNQDLCDLEKAFQYALGRGATSISVAAAIGGRTDHTLTSISIALRYAREAGVTLVDSNYEVHAVADSIEIVGSVGESVSLIVLQPAFGITLRGTVWELDDADLVPGSRGVSNVMAAARASLSVRRGTVLVCHRRTPLRTP